MVLLEYSAIVSVECIPEEKNLASYNEDKYQFLTVFSTNLFYKFSGGGSFVPLQEKKAD